MFSGVSGLRNHQVRMDVIGNNIANVNTVGFKAGRVTFQEIFSQVIRGVSSPDEDLGGINPQQVGLGMAVSSIDTLFTQGNLQMTGKMTDLALQGNGFFVLADGGQTAYTRSGAFDVDGAGYLIDPASGRRVLGWIADGGILPPGDASNLAPVRITSGQSLPAKATSAFAYGGNLDASASVGDKHVTSTEVIDSLGARHTAVVTFEKTAANQWSWSAQVGELVLGGGTGTLTFGPSGALTASTGGPITFTPGTGADSLSLTPNFDGLHQYASSSTAGAVSRDGYGVGALVSFTIDSTGTITGIFSNDVTLPLAQVAMACFANPAGLINRGGGIYTSSNNSGVPQIGAAGTSSRGQIAPGTLEMSNVDLSQEFTNMIVTQRGFQANSRMISTSDEMLQELVNLKR
jgi:flagellar hook protein FlgE